MTRPMDSPGPDPEVSNCEVLEVVLLHPDPAMSAAEVADSVGVTRQAADRYLRKMAKEDLVRSSKVGASRIWWVGETGREYYHENCGD